MNARVFRSVLAVAGAMAACLATAQTDPLAAGFANPPDSAKPWVYWFWLNSNIDKLGITQDLEAMKRVGIGGVLIMETDQGTPVGDVPFASAKWRELFRFMLQEADRLGIQVNMNDDAGWNGSGGPWITPELSMKKVVWTETQAHGHFAGKLAKPEEVAGLYHDIAVLAFPTVGPYRIPDIKGKSALVRQDFAPMLQYGKAPEGSTIQPSQIVNLTSKVGPDGTLNWEAPKGDWTIMRFGYTSTGAVNAPAPQSGIGLEPDKLSKKATEAAFEGLMGKLISDSPELVGKSLVRTHIDSWENGSQNWSDDFGSEFRKRRGYDLTRYLPVFSGRVVGSLEVSERFLWDLRQTISDMLLTNYAGHMRELAHQHGIGLSIEAYGDVNVDDLAYAGQADEPMSEFWTWGGGMGNPEYGSLAVVYEMASAAHIYGKPILGAEAFTSNDSEKWLLWPGAIKGLGDYEFSRGVNRFVFHRYALQPWANVAPGMSMGPWGLHYERTNTWWEKSKPWHDYLTRCQYLLQQGQPVVDVLYLAPEGAPSNFMPPGSAIHGDYRADSCPPEALLTRASVKGGRIVFEGGMSYAALVLPDAPMTLAMLDKVKELAEGGALIVGGSRPTRSPSLTDYPRCDRDVNRVSATLWNSGKIAKGPVEDRLRERKTVPDFASLPRLSFGHRKIGTDDVYFVANTRPVTMNATCAFRVTGKRPELWNPETGLTQPVGWYTAGEGLTQIPLSFGPMDSVFVVFRDASPLRETVTGLAWNGRNVLSQAQEDKIQIKRALWGPAGDTARTKDVTKQVQAMVDNQTTSFQVAELASEGDPAYLVVKTLHVTYTFRGQDRELSGTDPETVDFPVAAAEPLPATIRATREGLEIVASRAGDYAVTLSGGTVRRVEVPALPDPVLAKGPWTESFPKRQGGDTSLVAGGLTSWSESSLEEVKYFSGTATYKTSFSVPPELLVPGMRQTLDLGNVQVIADVTVNGKHAGILWRSPYSVDVTGMLHTGINQLVVKVTNLWPNRMIGDESLSEDSDRNPNGTLKSWPSWLDQGLPSPTGRQSFTSWRLWHKGDKLLPSGLLGPVVVRPVAVVKVAG